MALAISIPAFAAQHINSKSKSEVGNTYSQLNANYTQMNADGTVTFNSTKAQQDGYGRDDIIAFSNEVGDLNSMILSGHTNAVIQSRNTLAVTQLASDNWVYLGQKSNSKWQDIGYAAVSTAIGIPYPVAGVILAGIAIFNSITDDTTQYAKVYAKAPQTIGIYTVYYYRYDYYYDPSFQQFYKSQIYSKYDSPIN